MSLHTISPSSRGHSREWQLAVAAGFVALMLSGAAADRRNTVLDRSFTGSRTAGHVLAPATSGEMVQEMLAHD